MKCQPDFEQLGRQVCIAHKLSKPTYYIIVQENFSNNWILFQPRQFAIVHFDECHFDCKQDKFNECKVQQDVDERYYWIIHKLIITLYGDRHKITCI